ncbi:MAG: hypothetical protein WB762_28570 [Candidatus Sulfotelmatobacter sp.]
MLFASALWYPLWLATAKAGKSAKGSSRIVTDGTLECTLLEKSDGDYYLAIWNDIPVFQIAACARWNDKNECSDPVAGKDIATQNVPVTVSFSGAQPFTVSHRPMRAARIPPALKRS